jgi:apolipoprotein D and lipocalin family protein
MPRARLVASLLTLPLLVGCAGPGANGSASGVSALDVPETVPRVDLARYAGTWFEIARFPNRRCVATTSTYVLQQDGEFSVTNRCLGPDNRPVVAEGTARPVEGSNNAKLRVSFYWPNRADYWVLGLDPQYRWAVVGTPDRSELWILSRQPDMSYGDYSEALAIARDQGFSTARLEPTPQPG